LGASLDDVIIVYGENPELVNEGAWAKFIAHLKEELEGKSKPAHADEELEEPVLPIFSHKMWLRKIPSDWRLPSISILIGLIVALAVFAIWKTNIFAPKVEVASVEKMAYPLPDKPSIAVLPFLNMSDDPKQDYFSDGLTEEIITGLSKFPHIFVISRSSMFTYKGKNVKVQQVSEELGVQYVLEGSVQKFENRVKITVQLIDTIKGHHLWADRYDRELKDIFALQDEITLDILRSLRFQLTEEEKDSLRGKYTDNLQAYLKALEGSGHLREFNINHSLRCFEEARTLDPQFAVAYALEALSHLFNVWYGPRSTHVESIVKAFENARKCADIDDELAYCNIVLGLAHLYNREFIDAISEAKLAVERWPNSSVAATCLAQTLISNGMYKEALGEIERAIRLDPSSPIALTILGLTYLNMGRNEEAISTCEKVIDSSPRFLPALKVLVLAYSSEGRKDKVRLAVNKILKIRPGFSVKDFQMMFHRKTAAEVDKILNGVLKESVN
jgi:adenylate cyclase